MNALTVVPQSNVDAYRASTDAATICRDIVINTATTIQGRKYVCVEGWMAIAVAHGCAASAIDVERVEGGVRATGQIRRMADGFVVAEAEGFVGEDEPTWFGGESRGKTLPKRADYAIRAMAQTRAISRACRSAFAHVVVMMNAGLATTPAEEVPYGGFDEVVEEKRDWPEGPTPNKSNAMKAFRAVKARLSENITSEAFEAELADASALIAQFRLADHAWWRGTTSDGEMFESIPDWIARRRAEIAAAPADDGMQSALTDSMRHCTSINELKAWAGKNGELIDELADAERRAFEKDYDAFASSLETAAAMS